MTVFAESVSLAFKVSITAILSGSYLVEMIRCMSFKHRKCRLKEKKKFVTFAVARRAYVRPNYSRRLVSTPDGGTISLDWWGNSRDRSLDSSVPVLLCLHAFAGEQGHLGHIVKLPCLIASPLCLHAFRGA